MGKERNETGSVVPGRSAKREPPGGDSNEKRRLAAGGKGKLETRTVASGGRPEKRSLGGGWGWDVLG